MTRSEYVLAVLSPAGSKAYTPVQVQKLFFLLDAKIPQLIEGKKFNFRPYDYGPFDAAVYGEMETLAGDDLIEIGQKSAYSRMKTFRLTPEGQQRGEQLLREMNPDAQKYIQRLSEFVRRLSFEELVSAVYKAFPEMKAKSIFRDPEQ